MKNKLLITTLCLTTFLAGCSTNNQSEESSIEHPSSEAESSTEIESVTVEESSDVVEVKEFKIETEVADGYTSKVVGGETIYTFTKDGEYTISGSLNGQLLFDENLEVSVKLLLNNVDIVSANTCVYWQSESKKIELSPLEGTTNSIETTGEDSAIESNNNVEFTGNGSLTIKAATKHAVSASNITISENVTLFVEAGKDAFHGKEATIEGGNITINNCDDAFQVELNSKGKKGTFTMSAGTLSVSNCKSVVKADKSITIEGGSVSVSNCETTFKAATNEPTISVAESTTTVDGQPYSNN